MGRQYEVRVRTHIRDVNVTIDSRTSGSHLLDKVTGDLSITDKQYFKIQYRDRKGVNKDIVFRKRVLSHKLSKHQTPIEMSLTIAAFPQQPSNMKDFTAKFLVYREVEVLLKTGGLSCSSHVTESLTNLAVNEKIDEYLRVVESLEDYGNFHFELTRGDGLPCRLSINVTGITRTTGQEQHPISFTEIARIKSRKNTLKMKFSNRQEQQLIFYARNRSVCKDIIQTFSYNKSVFSKTHREDRSREYVIRNEAWDLT